MLLYQERKQFSHVKNCLNLELPKGVEIKKDTTADGKFHKYTVSAFYVSAHACMVRLVIDFMYL